MLSLLAMVTFCSQIKQVGKSTFHLCVIRCDMVHTDLRSFFSSSFQGLFQDKSHFFKGFFFHAILHTGYMSSTPPSCNSKIPKDDSVTRCSHRLFCLCFSLFECNFSALSPILETSIVLSHHWHNAFRLSAMTARTQPLYWGSRSHFFLYKHWPFRPFDSMTQKNSLCTRPIRNCRGWRRGEGYCNTLSLEGKVPKYVKQQQWTSPEITTRTWYRKTAQKIVSCWAFKAFRAQDNVALMTFYFFKDVSISFKDYWGKFKDFSRTWTNFSIFKYCSRGWCFFKARANHVVCS